AFAAYFAGEAPRHVQTAGQTKQRLAASASLGINNSAGEDSGEEAPDLAAAASGEEILRHRDIGQLTPEEREQLQRLFALLTPNPPLRRSRRRTPANRGNVHVARTVRRALQNGGEIVSLSRRTARNRPRRVVALLDVSGSMSPYADALLRFAHALSRAHPGTTEVFTIGTRLTRVTREMALRDPDRALAASGAAIPDWSGGTRLGEVLKAFLDRWGQRGVARGAVVILASDGWERGDPDSLAVQMSRLHRLAHRVIWVNPHKGRTGYEPLTRGMAAALPYVDSFVSGHSLAAFEELAKEIADA
ncbi:MAG: VWA domain-containing protein, partial [Chloroflexota bacterium]|nr:VWA domain-containing protein [Chloroflexota bacterium]